MTTAACGNCGFGNETGSRFCNECGSPLPLICLSCSAPNGSGSKFCRVCGTELASELTAPFASATLAPSPLSVSSRPSPQLGAPSQEERRLVTALFCDLVGFTPLSESLDPEDVRDIQAEYFDAMGEQIARYGGTVEKYAGDAVLALFGAPVAHENDAERAVLCALHMHTAIDPIATRAQERWGIQPAIRVGVNTGDVVSGSWNASGRQDVAVTGDAVNTAARIQSVGEPGEVLVGIETMRLTRRRITYGEPRNVTLKGKAEPVVLYPAVGVREEFGERWEDAGRATPLVGRDREMVEMFDAWMRAQGGEGGLISLVGDAGVGKSRLAAEFLDRLGASSACRVLRGRCLSYGQEISLWLLADLLRSLFGIKEQDEPETIGATVVTVLERLLAGCPTGSRQEAIDVLGEVLGLPPAPSPVTAAGATVRRTALIRSLRLVLSALSERTPTLVLLEDVHWVDNASADVLREVIGDVPGWRLLVMVTQRPGWSPPWSEWGWPERMTLRPLREADAALLAGSVLGGVVLAPDLEQYIAERAGGNPFFVEELLYALRETGGIAENGGSMHLVPAAAQRLPSTLTEILLARLDRLEGQVRTVAQVGSVIGRSFAVRLLAEVIGREQATLEMPLTALQDAEIAFPRRVVDIEYVFKHVTMQEVAYNTLVQRRRRELHLQTARAIATLYPSDEYVEMIAYHYGKTDAPEAASWLEKAGDRAATVYATDPALTYYREARRRLEGVDGGGVDLARLEEKLGGVLFTAGQYEEALEDLNRSVDVYRELRDLEAVGRVTARIGMAHRQVGTPLEGIPIVQTAIDLLLPLGPTVALAALYLALSSLVFLSGRYREALESAERAAALSRTLNDDRLLGEAQERQATALIQLGRNAEAIELFEAALPLIEAGGDLFVLQRALNNASVGCELLGQGVEATRYTERGVTVAERLGNPDQLSFTLGNLGGKHFNSGEWGKAQGVLDQALAVGRTVGKSTGILNPLFNLGRLSLARGDWEESNRYLTEANSVAHEAHNYQHQMVTQYYLGWLDLVQGRPDAAMDRLEPLVTQDMPHPPLIAMLAWAHLATDTPEGIYHAHALVLQAVKRMRDEIRPEWLTEALTIQAMILIRQGQWEEADGAIVEGLDVACSLQLPYAEGRLLALDGTLRLQQDKVQQGRERLEEALAIFRRLGAKKDIERIQAMLADAPAMTERE